MSELTVSVITSVIYATVRAFKNTALHIFAPENFAKPALQKITPDFFCILTAQQQNVYLLCIC